jgi:hypothetical protein
MQEIRKGFLIFSHPSELYLQDNYHMLFNNTVLLRK